VPKHHFETPIELTSGTRYAAVVALDRRGEKLGQTKTIRVT
jgi:hypothetical protein